MAGLWAGCCHGHRSGNKCSGGGGVSQSGRVLGRLQVRVRECWAIVGRRVGRTGGCHGVGLVWGWAQGGVLDRVGWGSGRGGRRMCPWSGPLCLAFAMLDALAHLGGCAGRDGVRRGQRGGKIAGAVAWGGGASMGRSCCGASILLRQAGWLGLCVGAGRTSPV